MRRLLLVCYYFPPLGLAGVNRPLNLFKHFPQHGYDCEILTVKPVAYRKYAPELLEGLDLQKIHRAGSRDPQRLMYLLGIREVNPKTIARGARAGESLFPDSKIGWVNAAVRLGKRLHARHPYDAIISTSPPISSHLVGMRLANECDLKWVADFRDPWTVAPIDTVYRDPRMAERAETLKREIVRAASEVVGVNRSIVSYLGRGEVITNGFDAEAARAWGVPEDREKFSIGLLGTFSDSMPLEPLFRVVSLAIEQGKISGGQVELLQVGETDHEWLTELANRYKLEKQLKIFGLTPRKESIQILSQASVMYVALAEELANATTSRIFDLLASGRPILAAVPPTGELVAQISDTNHFVLGESNYQEAVEYLASLHQESTAGRLALYPLPDHALQHSWSNKTKQYAELLGRLV